MPERKYQNEHANDQSRGWKYVSVASFGSFGSDLWNLGNVIFGNLPGRKLRVEEGCARSFFFLLSLSLFAIPRYILMIGSGRRPTDEFEKEIKAELPHFRASSR